MSLEHLYVDGQSVVTTVLKFCSETSFEHSLEHGKSPCFLRCCFSAAVGVDYAASVLPYVNVEKFSDCAF